jgi:pilus assembly protein CpaF
VSGYEGFAGSSSGPREASGAGGLSDEHLVRRLKKLLLDEVDLHELGRLDEAQRRGRLSRVLTHMVSNEGIILSSRERTSLIQRVVDEAVGLGVLEPILADTSVSEIMINGHDTIYVERYGSVERIPSGFTNNEQLLQTIDRIVSTVNRRVDESSPMVDARLPPDGRLPRGARVNVVLPPLALRGPTVTIRLFPRSYGLPELMEKGALDAPTAALLEAAVRARLNIVVSGGTASGKTTMLNALSAFIPGRERIITIEDAAELSLQQEHVVQMETRPPNVEGRGEVTIRDLVRNSLRMRPDRIIVGECRGGEALDMLQAMNTGHEGSLTTVHANTTDDALARLETMASMSDVDVPFKALHEQVNSSIDLVVQLVRGQDGTRRIVEVAYLTSRRHDAFELARLVHWDNSGDSLGRRGFVRHPVHPALAKRLIDAGEVIPDGFTVSAHAENVDAGGGMSWS